MGSEVPMCAERILYFMLANGSHMVMMNWIARSGQAPEHRRFKAMKEIVFAAKFISMETIVPFSSTGKVRSTHIM